MTTKIEDIISNPSAERAVISILLKNIDSLVECSASNLFAEHFAIKTNQVLYSVICYLAEEGTKRFDSNIIYSTIQDSITLKELDSFGGREYIDTLLQSSVIIDNLNMYIKQIKDTSLKRLAYQLGEDIKEEVVKTKDTSKMLNDVQEKILNIILNDSQDSDVYKFGTKTMDRLMDRMVNPVETYGYQLGWTDFDKITQGFAPNDLVVLVGESKTGKSTWLTNVSRIYSVESGLRGLYIDTEMTEIEQEDRMVAIISKVPYEEIRNGMFGRDTVYGKAEEKIERVKNAIEKLKESNLFHKYMPKYWAVA